MKAIVRDRYGPPSAVLELRDVEVPTIRDNEVLVRVRAASVNAGDPPIVKGSPYIIRPVYGIRRPKRRLLVRIWPAPWNGWAPKSADSAQVTRCSALASEPSPSTPREWPLVAVGVIA